jgi:hypothetical protein
MPVEVQDLTTLDPDKVDQTREENRTLIQEAFPNVELKRGVVHDIILELESILTTRNQTENANIIASQSLLAIGQNPDLADDEIVDAVLSNYRVERQFGAQATGPTRIVLDQLIPVVIPTGATFEANGVIFTVPNAINARIAEQNVTSDTDVVIQNVGDGTYAFTVDVISTEVGTAGLLRRGTKMNPLFIIPNFVSSFAEEDFTGGNNTETNAELIARFEEGIAAKVWQGRTNIVALVKEQEGFERILEMSIIGFSDPEMIRDAHSIVPVSFGGRTDSYTRTQDLPQEITLTRTATLISKVPTQAALEVCSNSVDVASGSVWQFSVGRDDAPGYYEVSRVAVPGAPQDNAGFEVVQDVRGFDLSSDIFVPDITQVIEGVYSRYQTAAVQFLDTDTDVDALEIGATVDYEVQFKVMPLIKDIQDFAGTRSQRNTMGDHLVKAPVPCFLSLSFRIELKVGAPQPDESAIKNALADEVNQAGFPGLLHASKLCDVVHDFLDSESGVSVIDMFGRIRRPDGTNKFIRDTEVLVVPDEPLNMVTGRTVGFILAAEDIVLEVVNGNFAEV